MLESLFMLVAGVATYFLITEIVFRWPPVGLVLLGSVLCASWHVPIWPPLASIAGLSVNYPDFVCIVLLSAFLLTVSRGSQIAKGLQIAIHLFTFILIISIIRGIAEFGLSSALNESRAWFYILSTSAWAYIVLNTRSRAPIWFEKWAIYSALTVSLVGIVNTAIYGFGGATSSERSASGDILEAGRPISSGQAVIVALAAVICLWKWKTGNQTRYLAAAIFFGSIVMLAQHRSVWIAFGVGAVLSTWFLGRSERTALVAVFLVAGCAAILSFRFYGDSQSVKIFAASAEDSRTYDGRVYDWKVLITSSFESGFHTVVSGFPFGSGWTRFREDGLRIGYIPHNWYVATYLRVGLVGLSAMVAMIVFLLAAAWRSRFVSPLLAAVGIVAIYCWAYNLQWYLAPVIGWILWSAKSIVDKSAQNETHIDRVFQSGELSVHANRLNASQGSERS